MRTPSPSRARSAAGGPAARAAFTFTELMVVVALVSVLAAAIGAPLIKIQRRARLARCTANVQQINQGLLRFTEDHNQRLPALLPDQPGDLWWWYKEQIKPYVGQPGSASPKDALFACPDDRGYSDPKPFHQTARFDYNSYVFNGVTMIGVPNIAGWQVSAVRQPSRTLLVMEWTAHAPLSWHRSRTGRNNAPFYCDAESVVGFVDGHAAFTRIYYDGYTAAFTRDPIPGYDYQYSGN